MKLYIMRHGETDWNAARQLQGSSDTHLNENGRRLARETGFALRDIPFALCISSPLTRAVETARLVIGKRPVPVLTDERIREITFGIWEGKRCMGPKADAETALMLNKFFQSPQDYCPPKGGESLESVCARTQAFLRETAEREEYQEKTILITSHGCAVRAMLQGLYGNTRLSQFWHGKVPPNCCVSVVEAHNGAVRLLEEDVVYYT